jgi:RNA polymerase sigma-70 factor (ECF subfamily)
MHHPIEDKIIDLIEAKDKAFVGLIYDHYADNLFGVVKVIVKDESLAQDVLQDSFLKIWQHADQYDPQKSRLFTWLLRICRNTAIDKLRSTKKRNSREIQIDDSNVNMSGGYSFKPQLMDIKDLMKGLEDKYQDVLVALFFLGMTQVEASEELNIPLGTVKSRLKIGLRELRTVFGDEALLLISMIFWA